MLVYGDREEKADARERLEQIADQLAEIATETPGIGRHAKLVGVLIETGQILQGVADADYEAVDADRRTSATEALTAYTQAIANAVCRSWDSGFADLGALSGTPRLDELPSEVVLRTPEGFAYYAVYPEAYIDAARRLRLTAAPRVIGIRSIGTTLAAVVAAALDAPLLVTVRPHGDPFARQVTIGPELEQELLSEDAHFVVVDEGPGLSGSSFGAVADWLQERGVPLERIAFMPSHAGEPGPQASEAHRTRWHCAQREPAEFGFAFLKAAFGSLEQFATGSPWERRKFFACPGGEKLLLKFAGLGSIGERKLGMARALHAVGLTPEPLGLVHGFLVERWCGNVRGLHHDEKPIAELAHYIGARARLFPADANSGATVEQLLEMSRRNVSLALGHSIAAALETWTPRIGGMERRVVRVRTDNKLDRYEWLRGADGRLLKTDALDHHAAHDLIGCQDMAWDVAGAIAEFALDDAEAEQLIVAVERASGRHVDRELLAFYTLAYRAFRLGRACLAAQSFASDPPERRRFEAARDRCATELQHLLLESGCAEIRPESLVG